MHNANRRPRTPFLFLSIHSCSCCILATPSGLHVMSCTRFSFSFFFQLRIPASHFKATSAAILHGIGKMDYGNILLCLSTDLLSFRLNDFVLIFKGFHSFSFYNANKFHFLAEFLNPLDKCKLSSVQWLLNKKKYWTRKSS